MPLAELPYGKALEAVVRSGREDVVRWCVQQQFGGVQEALMVAFSLAYNNLLGAFADCFSEHLSETAVVYAARSSHRKAY